MNNFFLLNHNAQRVNKEYQYWYYYNPETDFHFYEESSNNVTSFALGVAVGGKFTLHEKFIVELSLGIGRNFLNGRDYRDLIIVPRLSINAGYRF